MKAPRAKRNRFAGFSLVDPLIGILMFAIVIVGALNFWRLAEYKCERARIDARVSQILRESSDYVTYVAYDTLPANGTKLRSGFLLHPLDPTTGQYKDNYPFSVKAAVATTNEGTSSELKQIVLTLTYTTSAQPQAANVTQITVRTNALNRVKG
jgi:multidrug efflux pump subunit AcrA (membrane-fusion protein)